jgi:DNA recombination protein RmuC
MRGTWGEVQLGNLLEQILAPDQYEKNVTVKKGSREIVEFAIKLPGGGDGNPVWLPIDAKFPLEDYQKLVEAQERADVKLVDEYRKALENRIKSQAKDIRNKYIDPPHTTDFGLLFLPIEGLYAEVLSIAGLGDLLQREYRVSIAGPHTIAALLNSLQMGFRTLAIEKRASEVWVLLSKVKNEFGKFGDLLDKTHKKLQEASNTIEDAARKSRTIEGKLNQVQGLPVAEEAKILESSEGEM